MSLKWKVTSALVLLLVLALVVYLFSVLRLTEIDVNSGHLRTRIRVLGIIVQENVEETRFSRLVSEYGLGAAPASYKPTEVEELGLKRYVVTEWVLYRYGGTVAPLELLPKILSELDPMEKKRKTEIVTHMLALLKQGNGEEMNKYMCELTTEWK
jgi:hypothetical protein